MNNIELVRIRMNILLQNENAHIFNLLCELNKQRNEFPVVQDYVTFLFFTGLTFMKGQLEGSVLLEHMNKVEKKDPYYYIGKKNNIFHEKQQDDDNIRFNRIFLDGEPAEFKIINNGEMIMLRNRSLKKKGKWHSICLLKDTKSLKWKGDVL